MDRLKHLQRFDIYLQLFRTLLSTQRNVAQHESLDSANILSIPAQQVPLLSSNLESNGNPSTQRPSFPSLTDGSTIQVTSTLLLVNSS